MRINVKIILSFLVLVSFFVLPNQKANAAPIDIINEINTYSVVKQIEYLDIANEGTTGDYFSVQSQNLGALWCNLATKNGQYYLIFQAGKNFPYWQLGQTGYTTGIDINDGSNRTFNYHPDNEWIRVAIVPLCVTSKAEWGGKKVTSFRGGTGYWALFGTDGGGSAYWSNATISRSFDPFNEPPSLPGVFTNPTTGQVLSGNTQININWGVSTDPDGDTVNYTLDYFNGTAWISIADNIPTNSYMWTVPTDITTNSAKLRVRSKDINNNLYSSYIETGNFTISQNFKPVALITCPIDALWHK